MLKNKLQRMEHNIFMRRPEKVKRVYWEKTSGNQEYVYFAQSHKKSNYNKIKYNLS